MLCLRQYYRLQRRQILQRIRGSHLLSTHRHLLLSFPKQRILKTLSPKQSIKKHTTQQTKNPWDVAIERANHLPATATLLSTPLLQSPLLPLSRLPFQCHPQVRTILYQIIYFMTVYLLSIAATSSLYQLILNRDTSNKPWKIKCGAMP